MSLVPRPPAGPRPDSSELWSLAEALGLDLPGEKHLLHIVRAAMRAPLPAGWERVEGDGETGSYYFHSGAGQSRWFRPVAPVFHEMVRMERAGGARTAPSASSARATMPAPMTLPPVSQTPRAGSGSLTSSAPHHAPSAIPSASSSSSTLLSPPARHGGRAHSTSALPRMSSIERGEVATAFSLESRQALLSSLGNDVRALYLIARLQLFFRRWREKRQRVLRAKLRAGRATMDAEMMARLAGGKRRTTMDAAQSAAILSALRNTSISDGTSAGMASMTAPPTPRTQAASLGLSMSAGGTPREMGGDSEDAAAAARAAKRRASMQRMLAIQSRFGELNSEAAPAGGGSFAPSPSSTAATAGVSGAGGMRLVLPSTSAPGSTMPSTAPSPIHSANASSPSPSPRSAHHRASPSTPATPADDRRANRLNARRRTLVAEDEPSSSSATAPSSARRVPSALHPLTPSSLASQSELPLSAPFATPPLPSSSARAVALRNWQFVHMVVRVQRRFRASRAAMRARMAAKLAELQRRQTLDADRKLRRASMPLSQLGAIKKRLSMEAAEAAQAQ